MTLAASERQRRVFVAILGHTQPGAVLTQDVQFTYFDATVRSVSPHGGPFGGGTTLTIRGTGLAQYTSAVAFIQDPFATAGSGAARALDANMMCVWIDLESGLVSHTVYASLDADGSIRCVSPASPSPPFGSTSFTNDFSLEVTSRRLAHS